MRKQTLEQQYLEVLQERAQLKTSEKQHLQRLARGYVGECNLDKFVEEFLGSPELVMDDLNLAYGQEKIQVDKLIVIGNDVYLIDVKKYRGNYAYQDNSWYCGGQLLINNIFRQIDRAYDVLIKIFSAKGLHNLKVKRVLIFMDPAVTVEIKQPIVQMVLRVEELGSWLMHLKEEMKAYQQFISDRWRLALNDYLIPAYCPQNDFSSQKGRPLQPGICCPNCKKFVWTSYRYYLQCCHCGFCQSKEVAYVRTICDYGVLFFKSNLKRKELKKFFGKEWSEKYIRNQLKKHFQPLELCGRESSHYNYGLRFEYWFVNKKDYFIDLQQRREWNGN